MSPVAVSTAGELWLAPCISIWPRFPWLRKCTHCQLASPRPAQCGGLSRKGTLCQSGVAHVLSHLNQLQAVNRAIPGVQPRQTFSLFLLQLVLSSPNRRYVACLHDGRCECKRYLIFTEVLDWRAQLDLVSDLLSFITIFIVSCFQSTLKSVQVLGVSGVPHILMQSQQRWETHISGVSYITPGAYWTT